MTYVHPANSTDFATVGGAAAKELPVDLALGQVDAMDVVSNADEIASMELWYRLLNCGFHLPTAAGTDAMANYASMRGPVGLNRVYASVPAGPLNIGVWLDALKRGRTFATNGPLLGFSLGGRQPGDELRLPAGENKVKISAWLRSFVPVDHLEVICNGEVARDLKMNGGKVNSGGEVVDVQDTIPISRSGWCLLRAWSEKAEYPILDLYPYATTSPIYVKVDGSTPDRNEDAAYFVAWIDRLIDGAKLNKDWNTTAEKSAVLEDLASARKIYVQMEK